MALFPFLALRHPDKASAAMQAWLNIAVQRGFWDADSQYVSSRQYDLDAFKEASTFTQRFRVWRTIHQAHQSINPRGFEFMSFRHTAKDRDDRNAEWREFEATFDDAGTYF